MKKMLTMSAYLAIIAGIILVAGGIWGVSFTYMNVVQENIMTPEDARIPKAPVRGLFTLKAQADIIREHTLKTTGGKTYAEMPRQIPKEDESGNPILDENGKPMMTANTDRDIWITATTLVTALNLGVVTYAFSSLILLLGLISVWTGITFHALSKKY